MNLNKIGFWSVFTTAALVSFIIGIDNLSAQGLIPNSVKCNIIMWTVIFVAIMVTIKILSVFERYNEQMNKIKKEMEMMEWQMKGMNYNADIDMIPYNKRINSIAVGSNVIPFPVTKMSNSR